MTLFNTPIEDCTITASINEVTKHLHYFKGLHGCHVKDQKGSVWLAIVHRGERPEALLSRRIPNLQLDLLVSVGLGNFALQSLSALTFTVRSTTRVFVRKDAPIVGAPYSWNTLLQKRKDMDVFPTCMPYLTSPKSRHRTHLPQYLLQEQLWHRNWTPSRTDPSSCANPRVKSQPTSVIGQLWST